MKRIYSIIVMAVACSAMILTGCINTSGGGSSSTVSVSDIIGNSALVTGRIDENFSPAEVGACVSTQPSPTYNSCLFRQTAKDIEEGTFTVMFGNLQPGTKYYVRAFVKKGTLYYYGNEKSFTTKIFSYETFTVNGVTFEMVAVQGGTFTMGATSEQGSGYDNDEKPTHSVTLSDYMIGKYEVTQELWQAVMGSNPSRFNGSNLPVERVSWDDCQEFISRLNQLTGQNFRLPTEAEWEYAARGGNKSRGYKYSGSNNIDDVAWYTGNSGDRTHPVGTKSPNELGIYDMSGNVCEWCEDWYGDYSSGSQTNPKGSSSGSYRVLRGGSWGSRAQCCRVAYRGIVSPGSRSRYGFRVALVP